MPFVVYFATGFDYERGVHKVDGSAKDSDGAASAWAHTSSRWRWAVRAALVEMQEVGSAYFIQGFWTVRNSLDYTNTYENNTPYSLVDCTCDFWLG